MVHDVPVTVNDRPGNHLQPLRRHSGMRTFLLVALVVVVAACADGADSTGGSPTTSPDAQPPSSTTTPSTTQETVPGDTPPTVPESAAAQELAAARERWAAADIGDHTLVVQDDCGECGPELSGVSEVVVWEGQSYASGAALTVENVFATVERALEEGQDVEATYDPATGVPTEVWIDREARAYDGGTHLLIHEVIEGIPGDAASLDELRAARVVWDETRPTAYSFTVTIACGGCQLEGRLFTWVDRDEVVDFRVERISEAEITAITIDQVFDDLDSMFSTVGGFDDGEIRVNGTAQYHPDFGYPTWIGLDIDVLEPNENNAIFPDRLVYMISQFREQDADVSTTTDVEAARAQWEAAGITHYTYELTVHDVAAASFSEPYVVTVRDGSVTSALQNDEEASSGVAPFTIDELFALIAASEGTDAIASYDSDLGFPWFVPISVLLGNDEAVAWSIANLEPLQPNE